MASLFHWYAPVFTSVAFCERYELLSWYKESCTKSLNFLSKKFVSRWFDAFSIAVFVSLTTQIFVAVRRLFSWGGLVAHEQ